MKKTLLLLALVLTTSISFAQMQSGTLMNSGRKLIGEANFTIESKTEGVVIVELAVDRKGNVTGAKVVEGTTIKSTPTVMTAQNAGKKLKFTPGTHFAEFEHVRVKYTYKKPATTVN